LAKIPFLGSPQVMCTRGRFILALADVWWADGARPGQKL
jgi:hypothetical protein